VSTYQRFYAGPAIVTLVDKVGHWEDYPCLVTADHVNIDGEKAVWLADGFGFSADGRSGKASLCLWLPGEPAMEISRFKREAADLIACLEDIHGEDNVRVQWVSYGAW
jgi:hypothetical protein